jgi:hypothetical protein
VLPTPRAALDTCQSQLEASWAQSFLFFAPEEQSCSELAARRLIARLDAATAEEMRAGLALLRIVDPVAFEVALPPARPDPEADAELGEPVAVCGICGRVVALFPEGLAWRHYRGAVDVAGEQKAFDPGHEPSVGWYLTEDVPEELLG